MLPNDNPASDAKRQELIDKPAFGQVFSDNMAHMSWTKGEGWGDRRIEPYAPLKLDPGASVLHYAQEVFEGLKAYRHADGSTWLFRPDANAERFQNSAKRLYLPELSVDDFLGSVAALVKRDVNWVPTRREYTLYMRPFMFASEPFLGVRAPARGRLLRDRLPVRPVLPGRRQAGEHLGGRQVVPHRPRRHRLRQVRRQLRRLAARRIHRHRQRLRAGVLRGRRHQDLP